MSFKNKHKKAIWTGAFPDQFKALRPENTERGGVKAMSGGQRRRNDVYNAINQLFAQSNPLCDACKVIWKHLPPRCKSHLREETHHQRGRQGLLLFDVRYFISVCRAAHNWIEDNPQEARKLGMIKGRSGDAI